MVAARCRMGYHGIGKKLSVGYNTDREAYPGCEYGCHSEVAALHKLKPNKSTRIIRIDLCVTRVNKVGMRRNSRPCEKCIKHMSKLVVRGYWIVNVYFPNDEGEIIKMKFADLYSTKNKFLSSRFSREKSSMKSRSGSRSDSSDGSKRKRKRKKKKRSRKDSI